MKTIYRAVIKLFAICLVLAASTTLLCAQATTPLDSTYLANLATFSKNAHSLASEIWPGMKIGPFCIFRVNGPAYIMNHPAPPEARLLHDSIYSFKQSDYALAGTTQTPINNHLTAHNNYGQPMYVSVNQFYAELFHELHHVYQRTAIKQLKFENLADLLTYPEDPHNDALRQYENEALLEMLLGPAEKFNENLNRFYSCRTLRKAIIGEKYSSYEKSVESAEGPATYCEYAYMKKYSTTATEQEFIHKRFYYSLTDPTYGREGLRNKHLLSGMAQCIILTRRFKNWQTEYYNSGMPLNDFFFSKLPAKQVKLPTLASYEAKAQYFTTQEKEKHAQNLAAFNSQPGRKITLIFKTQPEFRGFDPMHAEAVNDSLIIHSTLLKLGKGTNSFTAINQSALTRINKQVWSVKRVTFFVPDGAVKYENQVFTCTDKTVSVQWEYSKLEESGNGYIVITTE
ncbi:hypothetical protein KK062_14490 [Fulvivirgaceae bacterium PWU5]|uniref:Uncharacterized protein n=1 Tax=Dawidia cretensis TaxID=2782350 RepID=A0AAP2DXZ3_9BACT|nr:hypothetical protein [Dawidia cretensis]MBT1709448.1 hypothetical protein [Dawidia cretensis]